MKNKRLFRKLQARYRDNENLYILIIAISRALKNTKGITPRLRALLKAYLERNELSVLEEDLIRYLNEQGKQAPFSEEEILAVDRAVALSLLESLSADSLDKEKREQLCNNAAHSLRLLEHADAEARYCALSSLEQTLCEKDAVYPFCTKATQNDIKGRILHYAKKHRLSEKEAALLYCEGKLKNEPPRKKGVAFFVVLYAAAFVITSLLGLFGIPFFLLPLLYFVVFEALKALAEALLPRFLPSHPIPRLHLEKIPDTAKTLVVIPTLLTSKNKAPFERLLRFYLANQDQNLRFTLLFDLAQAKSETSENDKSLLWFAEEEIARLNQAHPNRFFLFVRKRSDSPTEKCYLGRERKRGALIDLVSYCQGDKTQFLTTVADETFLKEATYLITLDADTDLPIGAAKEMVGAMYHPDNRPIIKSGAVRQGYGVLQPRIAVTVESACATHFSRLICGSGGIDPYTGAAFDTYQTLFGEGIFCGKGILDIHAFYCLIPNAFQNGRILSHDLLEGNLLRCGFLSDTVLTDSFPGEPLAYDARLHRWYRGDTQALSYAKKKVKNASSQTVKNPVGFLGRYKLLDNLRRILTPIVTLLSLLLSLFFSQKVQLAVTLTIVLALFVPIVTSLFRKDRARFRRYHAKILTSLAFRLKNAAYTLASLAHSGTLAADALLRSAFRIFISKKKLLEWTTAAGEEAKKRSALSYLKHTFSSMALGILTLSLAKSAPLRLLALSWLFFPLCTVLLARRFPKRVRALSIEEKAQLTRYAFDMWSYFKTYVTEEDHYLPPDNMQKEPLRIVAHRTSPTNIGMYLLSCLAARDFGFIDTKELAKRCENTLRTLEKLPKKYGHLYNWYDTKTLALLGEPFVSTVDSGNFVVSVITLTEGLLAYAEEEPALRRLILRYRALIEQADFGALYCKKRELFYIARDSEEPSPVSCYDLYMSESRTTSYYAIACGILPKRHWEKLSRTAIGKGRYIGLASWSGTAFEYFMPHLFLPILSGSLSEEALYFCAKQQKEMRYHALFGVSESAYYAFDADMNYQYRAHGNPVLALDVHAGKHRVIAPYASFLMLAILPRSALANLEKLKRFGAYGEHGFYEAIDFSPSVGGKDYAIIKSFMSHHVGMSMIAAANATFDSVFVKRFMKDSRMASAKELLEERIPTDTALFSSKLADKEKEFTRRFAFLPEEKRLRSEKKSDRVAKIALLSNQSAKMMIASSGEVFLSWQKIALTYPVFSTQTVPSRHPFLRIVFSYNGKDYAPLPDLFSYSATGAVFTHTEDKITSKCAFTLHGDKNLFAVSFSASGISESLSVALVFEPILTQEEAFFAHPFYRALSIEADFSKEHGILYFHLRQKENEPPLFLALASEAQGELSFDSRKDILPFSYQEKDILALSHKPLLCRTGATLSPLAVMRRTLTPRMGKASAQFLIAVGRSQREAEEIILSQRKKGASLHEALSESLRPRTRQMLRMLGEDRPNLKYAELLLSAIAYPLTSKTALPKSASFADLYRASISGDLPIIAIEPSEEESDTETRVISILLKMHRLLREKGQLCDLVFLCRESEPYQKPISARIHRLIAAEKEIGYLGKRGGIFLVGDSAVMPVVITLSCLYLPLDKNASAEEIYHRITKRKMPQKPQIHTLPETAPPLEIPTDALRVAGGYFHNRSFTVIKSEVDTPRAYVYASQSFGTLISASSPGYTWLVNCKERRLSEPSDDLLCDFTSERVLAEKNGTLYDLCAMAHTVEYGEGAAIYRGTLEKWPYLVKIGVDLHLTVKLVLAELPEDFTLRYEISPSFGTKALHRHTTQCYFEGESLFFENPLSMHLFNTRAFLSPIPKQEKETRQGFLFGVYPIEKEEEYLAIRSKYHSIDAIEGGFLEYASHYRTLFSAWQFHLPDQEMNEMLNHFLPYQTYVIRMLARTGYHQSGGAFGFRDQLQDGIAMLYYDSGILKKQILRCAAHQYLEGDVQHWWHPFSSPDDIGRGVRTRISDDLLFLPYAVCEYLHVTRDESLLWEEIPYLSSPPLLPSEDDRYESAAVSEKTESLYLHCLCAMDASFKTSERGIPLIGTGDWNDALNGVGKEGKGESVFLGRFMQIVFTAFAKICHSVNDSANEQKLRQQSEALSKALEEYAWEEDHYLRGSYDSGLPLGSKQSRACKIDSLSQSFSALAVGINDRTLEAMTKAYYHLYDSKNKLFSLFAPPFSEEESKAGYIASYCEGFRENGGQYNHGALFAAKAYFTLGEARKGYTLLQAINAARRSASPVTANAYRAEPYFLAADVYTNPEHIGRGGWTLYTGAAGWFLRTVIEDLLGYCEEGDHFTLAPALSDKMPKASFKLEKKNTVYRVQVLEGESASFLLDGKKSENCFFFDGAHHILEIRIEKKEKL